MKSIGIWGLREEARKTWDHVISDKVVYRSEVIYGERELSHVLAEKYLQGDVWIEIHWTLIKPDQREVHFNCICEVAQVPLPSFKREMKIERTGINGDSPVFVHVPKLVELPERMSPVGVFSDIRLKCVDDICHCGWEQLAPVVVGGIPFLEGEKLDLPLLRTVENTNWRQVRECPSQLIEGRSQATNKISDKHGDKFWSEFVLNPNDMDGLLEIVMVGDGIWFRVNPVLDGHLKRFDMKIRPAGFHVHIDKSRVNRHNAEMLAECGRIGA
jgi:hypothetical protein